VNMGFVKDGYFFAPRAMYPVGTLDLRVEGEKYALKCIVPPRNEEQERIIWESHNLLQKGESHVIQAGTGTGKTYSALHLASLMGRKTLVIVSKQDLMNQWKAEITRYLGIPPEEIGTIQQDICDIRNKAIVVGMLHSIAKDKYTDEVYKTFGLVIWDEVHNVNAHTFSVTTTLFPAKLRLGLSATPKRKDGRDRVCESHIGRIGVISNATLLNPKVIVAPSYYELPNVVRKVGGRYLHIPMALKAGRLMGLFKDMGSNLARNKVLVDFVKQAYLKDRNIVVFSDLIDGHLRILRALLIQDGVKPTDIGFYIGGMSESEREKAKVKKVVLATYQMVKEGTNVPHWDTAVLATPRADVKQAIGRVLRECKDKKQPIVFDLVDVQIPLMEQYFMGRLRQYQEGKANVVNHLPR